MRVYKVEKNWRTRIPVALACGNFAIIKIDTTGLDAEKDDIIGFHLAMYRMTNQHLEQMPHTLECYVMTDKKIPEEVTNINGISNAFLDCEASDTLDSAMLAVKNFLGDNSVLLGYNMSFIGDFLKAAMKKTGIKLNFVTSIDLLRMAHSLLDIKYYNRNSVLKALGIKDSFVAASDALAFQKLLALDPCGNVIVKTAFHNGTLTSVFGSARLNERGFLEELTPGLFDVVDMDHFYGGVA